MSVQPPPVNTVYYSPQNPSAMQGPVIIQAPTVVAQNPPKYEYTPNDFFVLSVVTMIFCGIFSPLSLTLIIPALVLSLLSRSNARIGSIETARKQGLVAAYLNVAAIIGALVAAFVFTGLVIGLYGPTYARLTQCYGYYGYRCNYY